jgi:hypothetical protein
MHVVTMLHGPMSTPVTNQRFRVSSVALRQSTAAGEARLRFRGHAVFSEIAFIQERRRTG